MVQLKNMNNHTYSAQQIQIQEGLEAVRKRPGMYIGSVDSDGLHHLIYEIVDNAIDEALAGYCNTIEVTLHEDNSVTVKDNGRGIPVDVHSDGKSALEIVMTKLHAGGKFSKDVYKISGGLHGVGSAVVNALSQWCTVSVFRDKKKYTQNYERGNVQSEIEAVADDEQQQTGTCVKFLPDPEIFKESQSFIRSNLAHRLREMAFLVKNVSITLCDEREKDLETGKSITETFFSKNGVKDFLVALHKERKTIIKHIPLFETEKDGTTLEFAFNYLTTGQESTVLSFVNSINTREGGTHLEGFRSAFTRTLNKHLKQNDRLARQLKENLQGVDVQAGIIVVLSLKVPEPTFSGQTKTKLSNSEVRGIVESLLSEELSMFLDHNPADTQKILEKCVQSAKARIEGQKAYETTLRKTPLGSSSLPGKLSDCSEKDPSKTEIFLVEGDSAGGTAKSGRDRTIQAILPLFGKPTNVEKMQEDIVKIATSPKLQPIIAALGAGVGEHFNLAKLRYHKVIIMADADVDGSHIRTLYLTFFFRYMRPLIENGHMYLAMPPLYLAMWGRGKNQTRRFAFDDTELQTTIEALAQEGITREKITIRRHKGLGEMSDDELRLSTMDPKLRRIMRVSLQNALEAEETFSLLLGEEVEPRREFIEDNALKVANLDI